MVAFLIQLAASSCTIGSSWAYGNKSIVGPVLGIGSQAFWWSIMFQQSLWGLLPVNIAMAVIHIRNFIKWRKGEDATTEVV